MKLFRVVWLISVLCIAAVMPTQAQTVTGDSLSVLNTNALNFPDVSATVRVQHNGQVAKGLMGGQFTIGEAYDAESLSIAETEGRLNLVFVIDMSANSNYEKSLNQNALVKFGESVYRSGDNISVMLMDGNDTTYTISSLANFTEIAASMDFTSSRHAADFTEALAKAATLLRPARDAGESAEIILVGSYLPNGTITMNEPVTLHTLHLQRTRPDHESGFRSLATGQALVVKEVPSPVLDNFYADLNASRLLYQLNYRSRAAQQGMRQVTITVNGGDWQTQGIMSYEFNVVAPEVKIVSPANNAIIERIAETSEERTADGQQGFSYTPIQQTITATVSFPDGLLRRIENATLIVDNISQPMVSVTPDPITGQFTLTWDIVTYRSNGSHNIAIQIMDYFGLIAQTETMTYSITVNTPEDVIFEANPCIIDGVRLTTPECTIATNPAVTIVVLGLTVVVAIAAIVVSAVLWRTNTRFREASMAVGRSFSTAVQTAQVTGSSMIKGATKLFGISNQAGSSNTKIEGHMTNAGGDTKIKGGVPRGGNPFDGLVRTKPPATQPQVPGMAPQSEGATKIENAGQAADRTIDTDPFENDYEYGRLNVLSGNLPVAYISIPKNNPFFSIGRNPRLCDYAIQDTEISNLHCRIKYDHQHQRFIIKDEGSSNGTYVNGNLLKEHIETILHNGDEIRFGQGIATFEFAANPRYATSVPSHGKSQARPKPPMQTRIEGSKKPSPSKPATDLMGMTNLSHLDNAPPPAYLPQEGGIEIIGDQVPVQNQPSPIAEPTDSHLPIVNQPDSGLPERDESFDSDDDWGKQD